MNDLEHDLRTLLERRFDEVSVPPVAPPRVLRRVRRRQAVTAVGATVIAAAVVVGSVVGLRALLPGSPTTVLPATSPVTETINGVTLTHLADWFVMGIDAQGTPLFSVTNFKPAANPLIECPATDAAVPATAAIMYVQETPGGVNEQGWPAELRPEHVTSSDQTCLVGWTLLRAEWAVAGREFGASVVFGPEASDGDRAAMQEVFSSMEFAPGGAVSPGQGRTYVVTTGTSGGTPWSLLVTVHQGQTPCLELRSERSASGVCAASAPSGSPAAHGDLGFLVGQTPSEPFLVFGSVPSNVVGVRVTLDDGTIIAGERIYQPPSEAGLTGAFFVIAIPGDVAGEVQALDANGDVVAHESILPPPPQGAPPEGQPWGVSGITGVSGAGGVATASAAASPVP